MAKAIHETRIFTDQRSGEQIKYDWYGIKAVVNGESMELSLGKILDGANKIAFKIIASGDDPIDMSNTNVETRKASESEIKQHQSQIKKTSSTAGNNAFNLEEDDSIDPDYFEKDEE